MEKSKPALIKVQMPDTLRHFSRDGPGVRLLALLILRLPYILATASGLMLWLLNRIFGVT